ncbi:MAG TPA: hypothetical protein VJ810_25235, partial [Blastocatellia bacterium]|nr:hypothetical protein [Blastocatellia bacterium]
MNNVKMKAPLHDRRLEEERVYWLSQLSGEFEPAVLPADFPPLGAAGAETAQWKFDFALPVVERLEKLVAGSSF